MLSGILVTTRWRVEPFGREANRKAGMRVLHMVTIPMTLVPLRCIVVADLRRGVLWACVMDCPKPPCSYEHSGRSLSSESAPVIGSIPSTTTLDRHTHVVVGRVDRPEGSGYANYISKSGS